MKRRSTGCLITEMKKKPKDCMTSELLHHALKGDPSNKDFYLSEYEKRLKALDLTDKQIKKFRELDETAINNGCYIKLEAQLAANPFIQPTMNKKSINVDNCTMSELVYLTIDSNKAFTENEHWNTTPAWELVCQHTIYSCKHESTYKLKYVLQSIGLTLDQINQFVSNESSIVQRLKLKNSYETL